MPTCDNCPEHGAMAKDIEYIQEDVKECKQNVKNIGNQITDIRSELMKLESREKILLGIFAVASTLISSFGSIVGCLISTYLKQ